MKTLLIFPPAADPAHPPLGISSLAAFLKANNEVVTQLDLNVLSYHYFLSKDNLERCKEKITDRFNELDALNELSLEEAKEYRYIVESFLSKEYLPDVIENALKDLQNHSTYISRTKYQDTSIIIKRAMNLVSAAHYPTIWSPRTFSMSYNSTRSSNILQAISDQHENIFIPFYEHYLSEIIDSSPAIIGISINYYSQLIPGLTLAVLIKKALRNTFIVVGGALLSFFDKRWDSFMHFKSIVDGFVPYEGEKPLLDLIRAIKNDFPLSMVSGLVSFDGHSLKYKQVSSPLNIAELPPPDFDDFPLDKYLSPYKLLPYVTSKGCYWGHCAFCSHDQIYHHRFNTKSAEKIIEDLDILSKRYRISEFYFVDDAIPPSNALKLSSIIKTNDLPYKWFSEIRFESTLNSKLLSDLSNGGCRMLLFGLESGVKRILEIMKKGTDPEIISKILRNCERVGIRTFVMFMVGFPGENKEEAEHTAKFIRINKDFITHLGFGNFVLLLNTKVYSNPHVFGISKVIDFTDEDLTIYADYEIATGMSSHDALLAVNELKKNQAICSLAELPLISRSHIAYLPHKDYSSKVDNTSMRVNVDMMKVLYPTIEDGVYAVTLNFNLENIQILIDGIHDDASLSIKYNPTNYVCKPITGTLVAVGEEGLLLLEPCNGKNNLDDIIAEFDGENKKVVLEFYQELYNSELLS